MRKRSHNSLVVAFLVVVIAALGALNVSFWYSAVDISPVGSRGPQEIQHIAPNATLRTPLDSKAAAQFSSIADRPLFHPARRPVRREPAAQPADAPRADLKLVGVIKNSDQPPRALIRSANARSGKWIAEGEDIEGWTLRKIGARSVVVESGGQLQELALSTPRSSAEEPPEPGISGSRR